jgi:hypothetical protein
MHPTRAAIALQEPRSHDESRDRIEIDGFVFSPIIFIPINRVNHGLCEKPQDWTFSSIHRFIAQGIYPPNWGEDEFPHIPKDIGYE